MANIFKHLENGMTLMYTNTCETSVLIDTDEFERVSKHSWWLDSKTGYIMGKVNYRTVRLQKFILNENMNKNSIINYSNGNKLDNRKCNIMSTFNTYNHLDNNITEILTYKGDKITIDTEDFGLIKKFKWGVCNGYAVTTDFSREEGSTLPMHRYIMEQHNDLTGKVVDHIYGNKLDNRKSKLRVCTQQENSMNIGLRSNNTTGVNGVRYRGDNKFEANIIFKGSKIYLGKGNYAEAVKLRHDAEIKYFGKFARRQDI